jgi:hypothetical protein
MSRVIPPIWNDSVRLGSVAGHVVSGRIRHINHYDTEKEAWQVTLVIPVDVRKEKGQLDLQVEVPVTKEIEAWIHREASSWYEGLPKSELAADAIG